VAKTILLPDLTLWQSHVVTIAFGSVVAAFGARRAPRHPGATARARAHGAR
jgi:hypothetical protein